MTKGIKGIQAIVQEGYKIDKDLKALKTLKVKEMEKRLKQIKEIIKEHHEKTDSLIIKGKDKGVFVELTEGTCINTAKLFKIVDKKTFFDLVKPQLTPIKKTISVDDFKKISYVSGLTVKFKSE